MHLNLTNDEVALIEKALDLHIDTLNDMDTEQAELEAEEAEELLAKLSQENSDD